MKSIEKYFKNNFTFLLVILFFTSVFTFMGKSDEVAATEVFAASTPQISYSVSGNTTVGSNITITVNAINASNIYGGSLDLVYDPKIIDITSISAGTLFKDQKPLVNNIDKNKGMASIALVNGSSVNSSSGSLAVINATVKGQGTVNLKTTNDVSKLALNGYTSCVKLSDRNGDKIYYNYTDKSIDLLYSLNAGSYHNTTSTLAYSGTWTQSGDSAQKYSNSNGSSLNFAFKGTGFTIYSIKASNRGIA
nr:cohesin domain-containing protein [Clostridium sp.]